MGFCIFIDGDRVSFSRARFTKNARKIMSDNKARRAVYSHMRSVNRNDPLIVEVDGTRYIVSNKPLKK